MSFADLDITSCFKSLYPNIKSLGYEYVALLTQLGKGEGFCCRFDVASVKVAREEKMRGLWNLAVLLLALQLSGCSFNFNIEIMSYFISVGSSPCGEDLCAPYLSHFCLRGPRTNRSYLRTDCPLGTSGAIRGFPVFVNISSDQPWEVSH